MKKTLIIIGALAALLVSALLDIGYYRGKQIDPNTFQATDLFMLSLQQIVSMILVATLLLLLAWVILRHNACDLTISVTFILIGLVMVWATTISGYDFLRQLGFPANKILLLEIVSSGLAFTNHSAAFILVLGVFCLLPNRYLHS
jgi:hypothetical protein